MKKKVNLFVIGASKCGTTTLWNMLNNHPKIFMSTPKEPWFFSFSDYKNNLKNYECLFESSKEEIYLGEASPIYSETTLIPEIPERIYNYNPDAKLIFLVRNPLERLKSVWRQTQFTGHDRRKVYKDYCDIEVPLMAKKFTEAIFQYPPFIEASRYFTHTKNYLKYFPENQFGVFFFEDLKNDPISFYKEICSFLDIDYVLNNSISVIKNPSNGRKRDYLFINNLKKNKFLLKSGVFLKKRIKLRKNFFQKEIKYDIKMNENEKEKILKTLDLEIKGILKYKNKKTDFWNYENI